MLEKYAYWKQIMQSNGQVFRAFAWLYMLVDVYVYQNAINP